MEESVFAPGRERFPGGQPGGLAADPAPGFVAAADFFFEQDADDLGGVPPLGAGGGEHVGCGFAEVGEAHPAQHRVQGVRDRRRDGRGGGEGGPGHGWSPLPPAARGSLPLPLLLAGAVRAVVRWRRSARSASSSCSARSARARSAAVSAVTASSWAWCCSRRVPRSRAASARTRSVSARASVSPWRARRISASARRAASAASSRSRAQRAASAWAALTCPAASACAAVIWAAASRRAWASRGRGVLGFQAGGGGFGAGGAGVVAGRVEGFGQDLGLGFGFGGAGLGGHGGCLGAAPGGLGLGDLGTDPGRVQGGGLLAGGAGEHRGLADHRVEGGQRVSGAVRGGRGRDQDAGIVVEAAGAGVAAELAGPPAVAGGQDVPAARPLADGRRGRAGRLAGGGIAGHDGTFRCQPLPFLFISDLRRNEKKRDSGERCSGAGVPGRPGAGPARNGGM